MKGSHCVLSPFPPSLLCPQSPKPSLPHPSSWLDPGTEVMTKYLQSQHILGPPVYMGLVANAINVFLNWLLVYHLGYGFDGAPVATSLCRWFQVFLFAGYLFLWPDKHEVGDRLSSSQRTA